MNARMVLELTEDGRFNMEAPMHNKLACYAMLGLAQEAIIKHDAARRIVPANGPISVPPCENN